jgi:hypothetical protein
MNTGTGPEKLKASQLYLKWNELKKAHDKEEEQTLPSAQDVERIREALEMRQAMDLSGVKSISDLRCSHCGGKFVFPDEADGEG